MDITLLILFAAGFMGGVINSLAGGGSFITFPALLFAGVPPISANATNTFASTAGYMSGTYAFREDILAHKKGVLVIIVFSLIGGSLGAWLLLQTSGNIFESLIPWLLLFATILFIFGSRINEFVSQYGKNQKNASLLGQIFLKIFLFISCAYGGFFNAGQGIVNLAYLSLAGHTDINYMNGVKLLMSAIVGVIAILIFILDDKIAWQSGFAVLLGTLIGGYLSAHIARRIDQSYIRYFVIITSIGTTLYFFYVTYFA